MTGDWAVSSLARSTASVPRAHSGRNGSSHRDKLQRHARQARTVVPVLEGKVQVSSDASSRDVRPEPLAAGEAAEVSRGGRCGFIRPAPVEGTGPDD